ncbi:hypothetical protein JTE90_011766 [Oedothorax gibbosus]|uniref:Uncharacterized protein n=1 Tax=Oedothorax gibbosus TaxID=931172 RepID=A0AAV6VTD7_9ARAC|nr:hypothetical protein JTE90_011766 [Oedothorax gibbosus]
MKREREIKTFVKDIICDIDMLVRCIFNLVLQILSGCHYCTPWTSIAATQVTSEFYWGRRSALLVKIRR